MLELGAGFGRWLVRAAFASRWFGSKPFKLIGVEAEPTHFEWMKQHFRDNGLNPSDHKLIRAALSGHDGSAKFLTGSAADSYGQKVASGRDVARSMLQRTLGALPKRLQKTMPSQRLNSAAAFDYKFERIESVSLNTLLGDLDRADLIDMDVQGSELEVVRASSETLNSKVIRAHIATHSKGTEIGLREIFRKLGWLNLFDFSSNSVSKTPWGTITFQDGVQTWINPIFGERLLDADFTG